MIELPGKRDQRVLVILSREEREMVEEYQFTKRIDKRAEAIRRLLELGMRAGEGGSPAGLE